MPDDARYLCPMIDSLGYTFSLEVHSYVESMAMISLESRIYFVTPTSLFCPRLSHGASRMSEVPDRR